MKLKVIKEQEWKLLQRSMKTPKRLFHAVWLLGTKASVLRVSAGAHEYNVYRVLIASILGSECFHTKFMVCKQRKPKHLEIN